MLLELTIRDFALIDSLHLEFSPNFNVITGETGAGKSILIGALGSLLGMRTASDMVRTGADRAVVEAHFRLPEGHPALVMVGDLGGDAEDGVLILRREMTADGRTRAWVGGVSVPVKTLRAVGDRIVDFHGQHDHQYLLNASEHGTILDAAAANEPLRDRVQAAWDSLQRLRKDRQGLVKRQRELVAQRDMIEFERKELADINPQEGEDDELNAERKVLENVERLGNLLTGLTELLSESDESVVTQLGTGRRWLTEAAEIDDRLEEAAEGYEQAEVLVQDLSTQLADRLASLDADPMRLEYVQERLGQLRSLTRRYGSVEEAIARREELEQTIDEEAGFEDRIAALEDEITSAHAAFSAAVEKLSRSREKTGALLGKEVTRSLDSLGMNRALLEVDLKRTAGEEPVDPVTSDAVLIDGDVCEAGPNGAEEVEFMIATNLGEPLKPLAKIASGGEISRVMLAIKSVLASHDPVAVMVFDEIDQGVSGRIGEAVAERMRELSRHRQIIAITHLPQIAAFGDRHIAVSKQEKAKRTTTHAQILTDENRVRAMAELLGGTAITDTALDHARDMLNHSQSEVEN